MKKSLLILTAVLALFLGGCVVYQPVSGPVYYGSSYDRVWDAAVGAAGDAGVKITSADRNTGIIQGFTQSDTVTISVATLADGRVRVEFSSKGPKGADPDLNSRFTRFYNMRMGRM
jgi:outer membrane lipoprotein SlyB